MLAIARQINDSTGAKVALTYEQHIGIPTICFGETGHFVTAVKVVAAPGGNCQLITVQVAGSCRWNQCLVRRERIACVSGHMSQ